MVSLLLEKLQEVPPKHPDLRVSQLQKRQREGDGQETEGQAGKVRTEKREEDPAVHSWIQLPASLSISFSTPSPPCS